LAAFFGDCNSNPNSTLENGIIFADANELEFQIKFFQEEKHKNCPV
jgi:hypothetical protein